MSNEHCASQNEVEKVSKGDDVKKNDLLKAELRSNQIISKQQKVFYVYRKNI